MLGVCAQRAPNAVTDNFGVNELATDEENKDSEAEGNISGRRAEVPAMARGADRRVYAAFSTRT
jgi:hypothetical protein